MENEGAPSPASDEKDSGTEEEAANIFVVYLGGHPVIRRSGVVLTAGVPKRVSRATAALLTESPDCAYSEPPGA
jgi:hypothetical protein